MVGMQRPFGFHRSVPLDGGYDGSGTNPSKGALKRYQNVFCRGSLLAGQGGTSFTSSRYLFWVGIGAAPRPMGGATCWQKAIQKESQMYPGDQKIPNTTGKSDYFG